MNSSRVRTLCGAVLFAALTTGAHAQSTAECSGNPCTYTLDGVISVFTPGTTVDNPTPTVPMSVNVTATSSFQYAGTTPGYLFQITSLGTSGSPSTGGNNAGAASGTGGITVNNTGHPRLTGFSPEVGELLLVETYGGPGGNYESTDGKGSAGAGGTAGAVTMTNNGTLTMGGDATHPWGQGALVLTVVSQGGSGGAVTSNGTDHFGRPTAHGDSNGGNGGNGSAVTVTNSAAITMQNVVMIPYTSAYVLGTYVFQAVGGSANVTPYSGFRGISAASLGGDPGFGAGASGTKCDSQGSGCLGGAIGGSGGDTTVSSSAPVTIQWDWNLTTGASPLPAMVGFGIIAASAGAQGANSATQDYSGGAGGSSGTVSITLTSGGNVSVGTVHDLPPGFTPNVTPSDPNLAPILQGAAVAALSVAGAGGAPYDASNEIGDNPVIAGGQGGQAGMATISVTSAAVSASGAALGGLYARSAGGAGGAGWSYVQDGLNQGGNDANGGRAGESLGASITLAGSASISTTGVLSPGIVAQSHGGAGGFGASYQPNDTPAGDAGNGGDAAAAGPVTVALSDQSRVGTTGQASAGIIAESRGGDGGNGGDRTTGSSGNPGAGGSAAAGDDVTVTLANTALVSTTDAYSPGIAARSMGGAGGSAGTGNVTFAPSPQAGGAGGASGLVSVTLNAGTRVATAGDYSPGVMAVSVSGYGGPGSDSSGVIVNTGGSGGAGGQAGRTVNSVLQAITASNAGAILTQGAVSYGLAAMAYSGGGGAGGPAGGIYGQGGTGSAAGAVGAVTVANTATGVISTAGAFAHGILAHAIGGGGGAGGSLDFANSGIGGSSGLSSAGGTVTITQAGSIQTSGDKAFGILAQSIGGGGGAGGDSNGIFYTVGGTGGAGGAGGTVTANLTAGAITTQGQLAFGVVIQSIGGGGGAGGDTSGSYTPTEGIIISYAEGGTAGNGGAGGSATLTASGGSVTTYASNAIGMIAQSIGGGGGVGGAAYAQAIGVGLSIGIAQGGTGGAGGAGGDATVTADNLTLMTGRSPLLQQPQSGPTNVLPVDAHGIVAQSIGGGGGAGGSASASAFAIAFQIPGTTTEVSLAVAASVGGDGSVGGSGGAVTVDLTSSTQIVTAGQGSHGVIAHSIGGGGGTGGDSSASAATVAYGRAATLGSGAIPIQVYSGDVAVAVGGAASAGANGGTVQVGLAQSASILTTGDYGYGVLAQSVGGGGGNAGAGSGTTADYGSTRNFHVGLGIGGSGAGGGAGGAVSVTQDAGVTIQTVGAGSHAIVVHSIGGGGGVASGGMLSVGGAYQAAIRESGDTFRIENITPAAQLNVAIGATGPGGGNGGQVSVNTAGTIITQSGDSSGVVAQSIGGGGGIGGTAGSDASSDNPMVLKAGVWVREFVTNTGISKTVPATMTASVSVGGTGGVGGAGGEVDVTHTGTITTAGDWSRGIVAQSIGGGGGLGGSAAATGSGSTPAITLNVVGAVGGAGAGGGNGGTVNLNWSGGAITTAGYAAYGILGQSIGGGGGAGADGSDTASGDISVGATTGRSGGIGGSGGAISMTGAASGSGFSLQRINTTGLGAHGIVMQSIGGGGGIGGAGSSAFGAISQAAGSIALTVGGGTNSSGNGGTVTINTQARVTTKGASAHGIVAQSIGGGGGIGFTQPGTATTTPILGAANGSFSSGGNVSLTLIPGPSGSSISVTGEAAHGIVAQSIGGGGGIAGYATGTPTISATPPTNSIAAAGNGGTVTLSISADVNAGGAGGMGIVAQSIAAGGGLMGTGSSIFAGSTGPVGGGSTGSAGAVSVTLINSQSTVHGVNGIGIFAQSTGGGTSHTGQPVMVTLTNSNLASENTNGVGIWVDGGFWGSGVTSNLITVDAGSLVYSPEVQTKPGYAILYSGSASLNVTNAGTIGGSYDLGPNGVLNNTGTMYLATTARSATLSNSGLVLVGAAPGFTGATIQGDFVQTASGVTGIDLDFNGRRSDTLLIQGNATLAGRVRALPSAVLPNVALPFLTVTGAVNGALAAETSPVFGYAVTRAGNTLSISATSADFTPAGFVLPANYRAVAGHLQSAWDRGGNADLAALFAALGNAAATGGAGAYTANLRQISPDSSFSPGAHATPSAQNFANATLSCPTFEGTTAMLVEGDCGWMRVTGRRAAQDSGNGTNRFRVDTTTWQIGGQKQIGNGWLIGGSLAYDVNWVSSDDKLNTAKGQGGYAAAMVKYQTGPWLFAASAFGGAGSYSTSRIITLPGFGSVAKGSPDTANVGLLLRAAFTIGHEDFYLRPSLSLTTTYARSGAYRENGAGALNLSIDSASQTNAILTPMLEIGGRIALADSMLLRPFMAVGVNLLSSGSWRQTGRLVAAPAGTGGFTTTLPIDQVVGRVTVGAQLYSGRDIDLRLQYDGEYGGRLSAHGGSFVASLRF